MLDFVDLEFYEFVEVYYILGLNSFEACKISTACLVGASHGL